MKPYNEKSVEMLGSITKGMHNVRDIYNFINIFANQGAKASSNAEETACSEIIIALKRRVRQLRDEEAKQIGKEIIIRDDGIDGYVYKAILDATNEEDAECEFEDKHYRPFCPTPWDCSGQQFTDWHRIKKVNGKYILWHSISVDI